MQYSTDGKSWSSYSIPININKGQKLYLKGYNPDGWSNGNAYSTLSITGGVSISGNVMCLLDNGAISGEVEDIVDIPCDWRFKELFAGSDGITSVSDNFLPATNLANYCYDSMFLYCTSLTTSPELPATSLKTNCYDAMFTACSSLTTVPESLLPATTLAESCY